MFKPGTLAEVKEGTKGGWSMIISTMVDTIENILANANYKLEEKNQLEIYVDDVKEKFGGLRFYYHLHCDEELSPEDGPEHNRISDWERYQSMIDGVIWFGTSLSYKTCMVCGKPGKLRKDGWMRTLCDECFSAPSLEQNIYSGSKSNQNERKEEEG